MKKHFLLLIMAFLSLTAWGQTIDMQESCKVNFGAVKYGGGEPAMQVLYIDGSTTVKLTKDEDYTWDGKYYSDEECTVPVLAADLKVGVKYYVKVVGKGVYVNFKTGWFMVDPADLKVTKILGSATPGKTYDGTVYDPELTLADLTFDGFVNGESATTEGVLSVGTSGLHISYGGSVNANTDGYACTITGLSAPNYNITYADGLKVKITPIDITDNAAYSFAIPATATYTYTGSDLTSSIQVGGKFTKTVEGTEVVTPLNLGTDFTVANKATETVEGATVPKKIINADNYTLKVSGTGNYTGSKEITLNVGKAMLAVTVTNQKKTYTGTAVSFTTAEVKEMVQFSGFLGDDIDKQAEITDGLVTGVTFDPATPTNVRAAGYAIIPTVDATAEEALKNYTVKKVNGKLTIEPRAITIKAVDKECDFGAKTEAEMTAMLTSENYYMKGETKVVLADADVFKTVTVDVDGTPTSVLQKPVLEKAAGTTVGNYPITFKTNGTTTDNFTPTYVDGTFKVKAHGTIVLIVKNKEMTYGDAKYPEYEYTTDGGEVTGVEFIVPETAVTAGNYPITVDESKLVYDENYTGVTVIPGTLKIKAKKLKVTANTQRLKLGNTVASLDQTAYTIDATDGLITADADKAASLIKLKFNTGDDAPSLAGGALNDATTYDRGIIAYLDGTNALAKNYDLVPTAGKLIVTDLTTTIVLNRVAAADYEDIATAANPTGKNDADWVIKKASEEGVDRPYTAAEIEEHNAELPAGWTEWTEATIIDYVENTATYDGDITYYVLEGGNYRAAVADDFEMSGGTVVTGFKEGTTYYLAVKPSAVQVAEHNAQKWATGKIKKAEKFNVTFGDYSLIAEKWYPLVLPFKTSVEEVSKAFGYAIVNVLNKYNADTKKILFKLHMGDIEANEPFVIKVNKAMNMNSILEDKFAGKTIVYSENPSVSDASGVSFIGKYSGKTGGFRANQAYFSASAELGEWYWGNATNKTYLRPLGAYFEVTENAGARTFEFEEADGTVTSISAIAFENGVTNAEGWYTVGGMKLQGAPTQKGVYIQNGKKVVIK